jgi:UDP-N-acetylmuramyl pentapeptide phosphotransferase/UDP-N-acetylglucosamine-1-phosphate transferase
MKMDNLRKRTAIIAACSAALGTVTLTGPASFVSLCLCVGLTLLGQPLFKAYAMARPTARSSHTEPVPQGGGAPVVLATFLAVLALIAFQVSDVALSQQLIFLMLGAVLLGIVGGLDDIKGLPVTPRLVAQLVGVACVVVVAPTDWRIFGHTIPLPLERLLLLVAGTWFVNLTNFMDGIDGITLAGFFPLALGAFVLSLSGAGSPTVGLLSACFMGALAGFLFFNWHPAQLFLGDVGSLPIGLLGGALLFDLAAHGAVAAAIILPLYHFTDSTLTLLTRIFRKERVWEAHRQHAYQRAVDGGWSHSKVSGLVLLLNLVLVVLAWLSFGRSSLTQGVCVAVAFALVGSLLVLFRKVKTPA